jgi:uncharacterized protein with PIN domain
LTLLDAYALVALVADEPAAAEVENILREGETRVVIINLAEAVDSAQRVHRLSSADVRTTLEPLLLSEVLLAAVSDEPQAWLAAEIRIEHYNRRTAPLSMADCFLIAHALTDDRAIATADLPLADVARAAGVEVIALPTSAGERP